MTTNDPVGTSRSGGAVEDPRDSIEDWLQEMSGFDHAPELRSGLAVPPPPPPGQSPFDDPDLNRSPFDRPAFGEADLDGADADRAGAEPPAFERQATAERPAVQGEESFQAEPPALGRPRHGYEVEPDEEPTGSWAFDVPRQGTGGRHRAED